jgi:hypothetical protein
MMRSKPLLTLLLLVGATGLLGGSCDPSGGGPWAEISINAISDELDDLLVLPPSGFVLHVALHAGSAEIDPSTFRLRAFPWNAGPLRNLTNFVPVDATGGLGIMPAGAPLLPGNYTLVAEISDEAGKLGGATFDVAVRDFPTGAPPIGTGQKIWYDFTVDRDGDGAPDFPDDLESFGLASSAAPGIAADVEAEVIARVLDRVAEIYHDEDPNGLGFDPVDVAFSATDPGGDDVTRICVGGEAPGTPLLIGSIYVDVDNGSREGVWCSNVPATGLFPRGIHAWQGNADYQSTFGPVKPSLGGTPLGEHPLDAAVLDPAFDPGSATPEELARWNDATTAIVNFSNVLAGVTAHETGHALGLVAPGLPGVGLHGGEVGPTYAHDVNPDGSVPYANYLMKPGPNSSFSSMGGLSGYPLPYLRPFDHAYLRDRLVRDEDVSVLLLPPKIEEVSPTLITGDGYLTITGSNFAEGATAKLVNTELQYPLLFVQYDSETQIRGFVSHSQVVPGFYVVVVENPDGQFAALVTPIEVQ